MILMANFLKNNLPQRSLKAGTLNSVLYKVSPFESVRNKFRSYEPLYFLTNSLQAKAFFLYQFGKVLTLINNDLIDQKAKLDSQR